MMQQKFTELARKRKMLKDEDNWNKEAQLKTFAERLAYETVLLSQLAQALRLFNMSNVNIDSIKLQDLMESHRKMAFLEKKLTNPEFDLDNMAPLDFYTSMLAEKLVVTSEILPSIKNDNKNNIKLDSTCRDLQRRMFEREKGLALLFSSYKDEKLYEIALVIAKENSEDLDQFCIAEATNAAQEIIQQEIINQQSSQSLFRICHLLNNSADQSSSLNIESLPSLTICSAEAMDRLQLAAEDSLKQEMKESLVSLSKKCEDVQKRCDTEGSSILNSVSVSMEAVVIEFAGIIAQKAIIDGHITLIQGDLGMDDYNNSEENSPTILNKDPMESLGDIIDSEAHLLMFLGARDTSVESLVKPAMSHAEFTYLFNKSAATCTAEYMQQIADLAAAEPLVASSSSHKSSTRSLHQSSPQVSDKDVEVSESPQLRSAVSMSRISASPKTKNKSEVRRSRRASDLTGMIALGCKQCDDLKYELNNIKKKLQLQNSLTDPRDCSNCPNLLDTIEVSDADFFYINNLLPMYKFYG